MTHFTAASDASELSTLTSRRRGADMALRACTHTRQGHSGGGARRARPGRQLQQGTGCCVAGARDRQALSERCGCLKGASQAFRNAGSRALVQVCTALARRALATALQLAIMHTFGVGLLGTCRGAGLPCCSSSWAGVATRRRGE